MFVMELVDMLDCESSRRIACAGSNPVDHPQVIKLSQVLSSGGTWLFLWRYNNGR